jgi:DNA topoisomerase I
MAKNVTVTSDPAETARQAQLRYVNDEKPGISRRRRGRGFSYLDPEGKVIRDPAVRRRIKALAIPPAWEDVWISPLSNGHIQATGRDEKGRKQYIYHPRWQEVRNEAKFQRMIAFGEALPLLRQQVDKDMRRHGLPREKVLGTVVQLLERSLIRIGNQSYARENSSYGLTTLRSRHVEVSSTQIRFEFQGKSGKKHKVAVKDRRLARIVKNCQELPGYELFQYLDDEGKRQPIDSADVNDYLSHVSGEAFTAKDFRTWGSTVGAIQTLYELGPASSDTEAKKKINEAIKQVAEELGNTPTICRDYYVHPAVLEAYQDGGLFDIWDKTAAVEEADEWLDLPEKIVLAVLRRTVT